MGFVRTSVPALGAYVLHMGAGRVVHQCGKRALSELEELGTVHSLPSPSPYGRGARRWSARFRRMAAVGNRVIRTPSFLAALSRG
jgi:hypothetical protein